MTPSACDPLELVGARAAAMLDPVAVVVAGMCAQRRLVRVEHPVDGPVALGVDADLPARRVRSGDRLPEVLLRTPVQGAGELALGSVRRRERRGAAGQGAIGVELHRSDRQPVVTEPTGETERLERVELRRDRHRREADAEEPAFAGDAVAVQLSPRDLRIDDRGDARGERCAHPAIDVGDDLLERRVVMEARSVVADVDRGRDDELLRRVEAVAGQAAAIVADEAPALRVGDRVVQPARSSPRLFASAWWPLMCWTRTGWTRVASSMSQRVGSRPSRNISGFIPTARIHVPSGVRSAASATRATRSAIEATPG